MASTTSISRPVPQYAAIEGTLVLAFNMAASQGHGGSQRQPQVLEGVSAEIERTETQPPSLPPQAGPSGTSGVCVTIYAGGQAVTACRQLNSSALPYDEALGLHFWNSGAGWWLLLPTERDLAAFRGKQGCKMCLSCCLRVLAAGCFARLLCANLTTPMLLI